MTTLSKDGTSDGMNGRLELPMDVEWQGAWLTWVAATTSCLRVLGVDCDQIDVGGASGYAFMLSIHDELCPSGPTVFEWERLNHGVRMLGRATSHFYTSECTGESGRDAVEHHHRVAHDIVSGEIAAGRPCVIWGPYVPEFAVAVGVDGDNYLVKSFRQITGEPEEPVPYNGLEDPGGPYVLAFPTAAEQPRVRVFRHAFDNALRMYYRPAYSGAYRWGAEAYDHWSQALEARRAIVHGNSYCAQCYAEGRRMSLRFTERAIEHLSQPFPAGAAKLEAAAGHWRDAVEAMDRVAELFPFTFAPHTEKVTDDKTIAEAVHALEAARDAEAQAMSLVKDVVCMDGWPARSAT